MVVVTMSVTFGKAIEASYWLKEKPYFSTMDRIRLRLATQDELTASRYCRPLCFRTPASNAPRIVLTSGAAEPAEGAPVTLAAANLAAAAAGAFLFAAAFLNSSWLY